MWQKNHSVQVYLIFFSLYSRLSLSRTLKGPGDWFEMEKVRDIENLTK